MNDILVMLRTTVGYIWLNPKGIESVVPGEKNLIITTFSGEVHEIPSMDLGELAAKLGYELKTT